MRKSGSGFLEKLISDFRDRLNLSLELLLDGLELLGVDLPDLREYVTQR